MEDPNPENRPKLRYIESCNLAVLHSEMFSLSVKASSIEQEKRSSEKYRKVIGIVFSSNEKSMRDNFNFAYLGQNINTSFNWYVAYEYDGGIMRNEKKYFTWKKMMSGFSNQSNLAEYQDLKGLVDLETSRQKSHIHGRLPGIIIEWTQEREDFLLSLEEKFRTLSTNLNAFLADLNADKLDKLIETNAIKLLGT
jgi:hypothetical protein